MFFLSSVYYLFVSESCNPMSSLFQWPRFRWMEWATTRYQPISLVFFQFFFVTKKYSKSRSFDWIINQSINGIGGDIAKSLFTPDTVINHHPRFATLTRNIRERRTEKVDIRVPLFRDRETKEYVCYWYLLNSMTKLVCNCRCTISFPVHPNKRDSEVAGKQSDHWPQVFVYIYCNNNETTKT